jgi:tripartite-type tricarboxylate transporter receptor subunit TctC
MKTTISLLGAALALCIAASAALGQPYPSRPVRLVVPFGTGGAPDAAARLVAQKLTERFGQAVIVENRPGGDTIIGSEAVAKAPPDGHTLLFSAGSSMSVLPHTRRRLPYDPFGDFVHVAQAAYVQFVLAAGPAVAAASVGELIALARSRPGRLTYASASESAYIAGEMFKHSAKIDIVHIPYKALATATTDLLSGQLDMISGSFATLVPHFRTKRLKALAVTGRQRSPALPDVPTMAEAGVAGFESSSVYGVSAPRSTPPAVVRKWSDELAAVLGTPDVGDKFLALGLESRFAASEEFTALLRAESEKQRLALQRIGFKIE